MKYALPFAALSCLIALTISAGAKTMTPVPVMEKAESSRFHGSINKIQAAELLEKIIVDGQDRRIMLKYIGIDPRILATVHTDQIQIRFRHFTEFSQNPVGWSREGSKMKDFLSKWTAVSNVSATLIQGDEDMTYYALELFKANGHSSTFIPLHEKPAGYEFADALLAALILQGSIPAATTSDRHIPPPGDAKPTPTATLQPTAVPTPLTTPAATAQQTSIPDKTTESTPEPEIKTPTKQTIPEAVIPEKVQAQPASVRQKLQTLKELYEEGLIDQEIYLDKQRAILDKL